MNSSPIFKVKRIPTSTISRPPTTAPSSPQPCTSGEQQKKCDNKTLVDYSDSLDDDCEIVDITGMSTDSETRFKTPVSEVELQNLGGKTFAASTDRKILWAKKLFDDWKRARNEYNKRGSICVDLDADHVDKFELSAALCQFLAEVRRADGHDYPGNTLYSIVVMLQLHFEKKGQTLKLIDDPEFVKVKNTLDNLMKKRAADRVSETKKAADPISVQAEDELWRQNVLGSDDADQLRDTVLYLIGLTFALRGGKEHRSWRCPPSTLRFVFSKQTQAKNIWSTGKIPKAKATKGGCCRGNMSPKLSVLTDTKCRVKT